MTNHFVSATCEGEVCPCGKPATHKISEVFAPDDPVWQSVKIGHSQTKVPSRHEFTAYVCCEHFSWLIGSAAPCYRVKLEDGR